MCIFCTFLCLKSPFSLLNHPYESFQLAGHKKRRLFSWMNMSYYVKCWVRVYWALNAIWHAWYSPQVSLQKDETETNIDLHTCQIAKCWRKYLLSPLLSLSLSLYETEGPEHNEEQKSKEAEFLGPQYTLVSQLTAEVLRPNRSRMLGSSKAKGVFLHFT